MTFLGNSGIPVTNHYGISQWGHSNDSNGIANHFCHTCTLFIGEDGRFIGNDVNDPDFSPLGSKEGNFV